MNVLIESGKPFERECRVAVFGRGGGTRLGTVAPNPVLASVETDSEVTRLATDARRTLRQIPADAA